MYLIFAGGTFDPIQVSGAESLLTTRQTSKEANDFIDRDVKRSNFDWYEILCLDTMKVETYFRVNEELRLHKIWNAEEYMRDRKKPAVKILHQITIVPETLSTDIADSDSSDYSNGSNVYSASDSEVSDASEAVETPMDASSEIPTDTLTEAQSEAPIRVSDASGVLALENSFIQIF